MRRFFVEEIKKRNGFCVISGTEARHISRVLRMDKGDNFILMDGGGNRFEAVLESKDCQDILVRLKRPLPKPITSPVKIRLCQSLLKAASMDYVIQKTSELGVYGITPFHSQRTVVRLNKENTEGRLKRWKKIAISSAKQSDRLRPAEIDTPVLFKDLFKKWRHNDVIKVIMWEGEESQDLKKILRSSLPANNFIGIVGPEGGFTRDESEAAKDAGFISVSVGNRILRAETAAMTLVAIVQYEWGDLSLQQ